MSAARLMAAFTGTELPSSVAAAIARGSYAGVSLFRAHNVESLEQLRALNASIQAAAPRASRPMLIATDQETGQLAAVAHGTTQFAGAMALGAAGDEDLAERVARAIARELLALGVNVNYSPVCDLADAPANPAMGIRAYGDDPPAVARLVAATVRGLQAEGVAATAKHFPGIGRAGVDTHDSLAVVPGDMSHFEQRELVPFRAAVEAGARVVMAGHAAVPGLGADETLPASLARPVVTELLRGRLGFRGVTITDALDMGAIAQGTAQVVDVIAALRAGEDLLLATADEELVDRVEQAIAQAELRELVDPGASSISAARLAELRTWLAAHEQPTLEVVGCAEHQELARELAQRSITLVRDDDGLLPLRPRDGARLLVVEPLPANLTPADTSLFVEPTFAAAVRSRWSGTDGIEVAAAPSAAEISAVLERVAGYDVVLVGTAAAHLQPSHAALASAILEAGRPTVTVAMRTPWDLATYASSRTHVATYSRLPPSTDALAAVLFGEVSPVGRLPVMLGDLHARGHGLTPWH
jgi:beta-N-acetylhexosaminidase